MREATTYGPHRRKGYVGSFHCDLLFNPVSIQEAMQIPEAKAAVDKEWDALKKIPA